MLPSNPVQAAVHEKEAPPKMGEVPLKRKVRVVCHCRSLFPSFSQFIGTFIMLVVVESIVMSRQLLMFTGFKMRLILRRRRQWQMSRDIENFM